MGRYCDAAAETVDASLSPSPHRPDARRTHDGGRIARAVQCERSRDCLLAYYAAANIPSPSLPLTHARARDNRPAS